ncbi:ATP-binding cassette domain-containing protein, partial [Paracoccus liaowanqingii]
DPASWLRGATRAAEGAPVLRAEGLAVSRGGRMLFQGLDLAVHPGQILGVTGPSGCGKSSLGDTLLGLAPADAGRVAKVPGIAPVRYQKLYQDPPSAFPRTVTLGRALADLVALHRLDGARIAPLLDRLRLSPALLARRPTEVSGGELQRLALLRVLLLDPVFLFADEPTSRLDLITQAEVTALMVEVARETGMGLMIVSHDAQLVARTCDRVVALAGADRARAA